MQVFGKFSTNFDMDYLVEQYMYINENEEEKITVDDLENMLKKKRKTVAGTVFLYNPEVSPVGYKMSRFLQEEGFDKYDEFVPLNESPKDYVLNAGFKEHYKGKLVQIRYLFNYNRENIEPTPILEEFDADLDKITSSQLTRYDKQLNYIDIPNIRLSGKFVFFGIGNKYDRHHKSIIAYARALSLHVNKLDKNVVFMYDNNYDLDECIERAYYLSPFAGGKAREVRANAVKAIFKTLPPQRVKI
ncbi:hypothetical protein [Sulfurimonas hydrogeniphila]|uniref:hypothetical protein n=1 Tax=Sulfurimonas hydrogeniphila TaxID=2509341 RepID=UPI00125FFB8B|nr:hypothetical protein [Sulfurimonas hydrogeniphila]